jgi:hypothetical protein
MKSILNLDHWIYLQTPTTVCQRTEVGVMPIVENRCGGNVLVIGPTRNGLAQKIAQYETTSCHDNVQTANEDFNLEMLITDS